MNSVFDNMAARDWQVDAATTDAASNQKPTPTTTTASSSSSTTTTTSMFDFSPLTQFASAFHSLTAPALTEKDRDPPPSAPDTDITSTTEISSSTDRPCSVPPTNAPTTTKLIAQGTLNLDRDNSNSHVSIHNMLQQASKTVPRMTAGDRSDENNALLLVPDTSPSEEALMKDYCDRLMAQAQKKRADSCSTGCSSPAADTDQQLTAVNDPCLLQSVCSSGSQMLQCVDDTTTISYEKPKLEQDKMADEMMEHRQDEEEEESIAVVVPMTTATPCDELRQHCDLLCTSDEDYLGIDDSTTLPAGMLRKQQQRQHEATMALLPEDSLFGPPLVVDRDHEGTIILSASLTSASRHELPMMIVDHHEDATSEMTPSGTEDDDDEEKIFTSKYPAKPAGTVMGTASDQGDKQELSTGVNTSELKQGRKHVVKIRVDEDEINIEWAAKSSSMGTSGSCSSSLASMQHKSPDSVQPMVVAKEPLKGGTATITTATCDATDYDDAERYHSTTSYNTDGELMSQTTGGGDTVQSLMDEGDDDKEGLTSYLPFFSNRVLFGDFLSSVSTDDEALTWEEDMSSSTEGGTLSEVSTVYTSSTLKNDSTVLSEDMDISNSPVIKEIMQTGSLKESLSTTKGPSFRNMCSATSGSPTISPPHRTKLSVPATFLLPQVAHSNNNSRDTNEVNEIGQEALAVYATYPATSNHQSSEGASWSGVLQNVTRKIEVSTSSETEGKTDNTSDSVMEPVDDDLYSSSESASLSIIMESDGEKSDSEARPLTKIAECSISSISPKTEKPCVPKKEIGNLLQLESDEIAFFVTNESSSRPCSAQSGSVIVYQSSCSGEEKTEEPSESASQLLQAISPKNLQENKARLTESTSELVDEGFVVEEPSFSSTRRDFMSADASNSSESNIVMSRSGSESCSYESEILDGDDFTGDHNNSPPFSAPFQPTSSDGVDLALTQPYTIKGFSPSPFAPIGLQMKKKKPPTLISSLIRKIELYDETIIANKTRRQLLRTAAALPLTSHGKDGETNPKLQAFRGDRPLSPNSLFTMFSTSSDSNSSASGDDQGSERTANSLARKKVSSLGVERAASDFQSIEILALSADFEAENAKSQTNATESKPVADINLELSTDSEQSLAIDTSEENLESSVTEECNLEPHGLSFTGSDAEASTSIDVASEEGVLTETEVEHEKGNDPPALSLSGDSTESGTSQGDSSSDDASRPVFVPSGAASTIEGQSEEDSEHLSRHRFNPLNLFKNLRSILPSRTPEGEPETSLREPLLPQIGASVDEEDAEQLENDLDIEQGGLSTQELAVQQQPTGCCSRVAQRCCRWQTVLHLIGFFVLLSVVFLAGFFVALEFF